MRRLYFNTPHGQVRYVTFAELAQARSTSFSEDRADGIVYPVITSVMPDKSYDRGYAWFARVNKVQLGQFFKSELRSMCRQMPQVLRSVDDLFEVCADMAQEMLEPDAYVRISSRSYLLLCTRCMHMKVDRKGNRAAVYFSHPNAYRAVKLSRGPSWLTDLIEELGTKPSVLYSLMPR